MSMSMSLSTISTSKCSCICQIAKEPNGEPVTIFRPKFVRTVTTKIYLKAFPSCISCTSQAWPWQKFRMRVKICKMCEIFLSVNSFHIWLSRNAPNINNTTPQPHQIRKVYSTLLYTVPWWWGRLIKPICNSVNGEMQLQMQMEIWIIWFKSTIARNSIAFKSNRKNIKSHDAK